MKFMSEGKYFIFITNKRHMLTCSSIDTDFLLIVLRSLMLRRPELKVVLMSATVDAQRFSRYLSDAPILNVPGRTFPVQTKYLEDAVELTHYTKSADEGYNDSDTSEN